MADHSEQENYGEQEEMETVEVVDRRTGKTIDLLLSDVKKSITPQLGDVLDKKRKLENEYYFKRIKESREKGENVDINMETVVNGLKYIVEHPNMDHSELVDNLISLGCNFTKEDIDKQFPEKSIKSSFRRYFEEHYFIERKSERHLGLKKGDIRCAAYVIFNVMKGGKCGRVREYFIDKDGEGSVYYFLRKVMGKEEYRRRYADSVEGRW